MNQIHIVWADEDDEVDALLRDWKGRSKGGDRYLYLIARVRGQTIGVLEGHHDWANWQLLKDWQHLEQHPEARGSYVSSIFVTPDARGQGVGAALLDRFEQDARRHHRPVIVAWPDEDDDGRRKRLSFFSTQGFAFANYPGNVREPWLMTKTLE